MCVRRVLIKSALLRQAITHTRELRWTFLEILVSDKCVIVRATVRIRRFKYLFRIYVSLILIQEEEKEKDESHRFAIA